MLTSGLFHCPNVSDFMTRAGSRNLKWGGGGGGGGAKSYITSQKWMGGGGGGSGVYIEFQSK